MPLSDVLRQPANKLLAALSTKSYKHLAPLLEPTVLKLGDILYHPKEVIRQVYFPHKSIISMVNILEDGSMVEVGVVGSEGMLGTALLSGDNISTHQAIVQVANGSVRMKAAAFQEEIRKNSEFNILVQRYLQALFTQVAQTAACNRLHPIVERLARWLLLTQDRMETERLQLTHEFIATMLGTRRAGVTVAAGTLQAAGIITYNRGAVIIRDRERLEEASCECYRIVRDEYDRLLGKYLPNEY
jgi:CRP-like cAMP-binding protein